MLSGLLQIKNRSTKFRWLSEADKANVKLKSAKPDYRKRAQTFVIGAVVSPCIPGTFGKCRFSSGILHVSFLYCPFTSSKSSEILCLLNRQVKVHGNQVCHGNSYSASCIFHLDKCLRWSLWVYVCVLRILSNSSIDFCHGLLFRYGFSIDRQRFAVAQLDVRGFNAYRSIQLPTQVTELMLVQKEARLWSLICLSLWYSQKW